MTLRVRPLTRGEHLGFVTQRRSCSFLQTPAWGAVKQDWRAESIGWSQPDDPEAVLVGAGLVLYRQLPRLRRYLAYLPEGPDIDWSDPDLARWLVPLVDHLRRRRAFAVRMGPPVVTRRWTASTVKDAVAAGGVQRLADLAPDDAPADGARVTATLARLGWRPPRGGEGGFGAGQPRHVFQLPLDGRREEDLLAGFNQQWRRNVKKAEKSGVVVQRGGTAELEAFHGLYVETARRDGFSPRPLPYFTTMWQAMTAEDPDRIRLYLARHEGDLVAAATMVRVGVHAWYSYGASSAAKRDVRGSNAVQWQMMRDALAAGAGVYDLRGITDTLDEADPHFGLIRFKLGTGGEVVEYAGEWDLPLSRPLWTAFDLYLRRR